jgi:hypothetical protein
MGKMTEYPETTCLDDQKYIREDLVNTTVERTEKHGYYPVGDQVMIRTVTMIYVGTLIDVTDNELVIVRAAWIPDTGRWSEFMRNGTAEEVEPYVQTETVLVSRGAVLDVSKINGDFKEVK